MRISTERLEHIKTVNENIISHTSSIIDRLNSLEENFENDQKNESPKFKSLNNNFSAIKEEHTMENLRTHRSQNQFSSENPQKLEKMFDKPFLINVSAFDHPSA